MGVNKLERHAEQLAALGHVARLSLLRAIVQAGPEGISTTELQERLDIPWTTLNHHLEFTLVEVAVEPLVLAHDVAGGFKKASKRLGCGHRYGAVCAVLLRLSTRHRGVLAVRLRPVEAVWGRQKVS